MDSPKKSLGQHWLHDKNTLQTIAETAKLESSDTVLEIGPGLGTLTQVLTREAGQVIAVEMDEILASQLAERVRADNLQVVAQDILKFDLTSLPPSYKVVANIPYYLTANLLRILTESPNPPDSIVLLVQKEVAERIAAEPGDLSLLAVSVQLDYEPQLGLIVPAGQFTPPPKVDSQLIYLKRRPEPLFPKFDRQKFFRVVRAGFSERRKKLRSSLAGGLAISKQEADSLLEQAGVDGNRRAQELSLADWYKISTFLSLNT